jgi:DNA ligase-1
MELPTLYTLTGTQSIRYWKISVSENDDGEVEIRREYGKHGGKAIINNKVISEAKSRKTVYEQAVFEAKNDWKEKKDKKGYVDDIELLTTTSSQLSGPSGPSTSTSSEIKPKKKLLRKKLQPEEVEAEEEEITPKKKLLRKKVQPDESEEITPKKKGKMAEDTDEEGEEIIPREEEEGTKALKKIIRPKGYIPPTPPMGGNPPRGVMGGFPPQFKFLPMLANKWMERKKYVRYPCVAQPKLDGIRYTARKVSSTEVELHTRNDAICPFFTEIKDALVELELDVDVLLDGEFYSKSLQFRTLNGYCNRKKLDGKSGYDKIPKEDLLSIQYNIFDCYFINEPDKPFNERYTYIKNIMEGNASKYLQLVPIVDISNEQDILTFHEQFVGEGFEGIMIRNVDSPYKLKDRSNDLLKYKHFQDSEFVIVGAKAPTNGKEDGCIIWELGVPDTDLVFSCRPRQTYESRKTDWEDYQKHPKKYIGQQYTVRYQETYANGIPRFPSGISLRNSL